MVRNRFPFESDTFNVFLLAIYKMKIYRHIATSDDISEIPPKKFWLPKNPVRVKPNKHLNLRLIEFAMQTEKWQEVYGFRRLEQLQTLLMANALKTIVST